MLAAARTVSLPGGAVSASAPALDWGGAMPFLLLTGTALGPLALDLVVGGRGGLWLSATGVGGLAITGLTLVRGFGAPEAVVGGMLVLDDFARFFHVVFLCIAALTILVAGEYVEQMGIPPGEFYAMILFAVLGMMVMASAADLIMVFLGHAARCVPLS